MGKREDVVPVRKLKEHIKKQTKKALSDGIRGEMGFENKKNEIGYIHSLSLFNCLCGDKVLVKADVSLGKGMCTGRVMEAMSSRYILEPWVICALGVLKMGLPLVERVQVFLSIVTACGVFMMTITLYASLRSVLPVKGRYFSVLLYILRVLLLFSPLFSGRATDEGFLEDFFFHRCCVSFFSPSFFIL